MNNEKQTDDGGAAFPHSSQPLDAQGNPMMENHTQWGMTLRDWFAGQALASLEFTTAIEQAISEGFKATQAGEYIAQSCYKMADAMIAARKGKV